MELKEPSGPRPIASVIRDFLQQNGLGRSRSEERACRAWSDAAGMPWRELAFPLSFRSGRLTVEVASSVALAELKGFHGESLRARANAALGWEEIRKVVFKLKN